MTDVSHSAATLRCRITLDAGVQDQPETIDDAEIACANCVYWCAQSQVGQCRRFPPLVYLAPGSSVLESVWPMTRADGWCGEYEPTDDDA